MKKINENIKLIIGIIVAIVISSMISIKAATTLSSTSVYYDTSKSGGSSSNVNGAIDELYSLTTDRDKLKTDSGIYSCGGYDGTYCGALIMNDGWEIKDDYPR